MGVVTTGAVLLRSHPFSETSLVLRFFTEELGTLGVMAKGARRSSSRSPSGLETFAGGRLTVYVKESRGLQTLKDFAVERPRSALGDNVLRFAGASVLGELVLRHGGEAGNPPLYAALTHGLDRLLATEDDRIVGAVLAEGWRIVSTLGYHPVITTCVSCSRPLGDEEMGRFDFGAGGLRCAACARGGEGPRVGPGARDQLGHLLEGRTGPLTHLRAHLRLLSDFVTYHVSGSRPLDSFRVLVPLVPDDAETP